MVSEVSQAIKSWVSGWAKSVFYTKESFVSSSQGTASGGNPVRLNSSGLFDFSFIDTTALRSYLDAFYLKLTGGTLSGQLKLDSTLLLSDSSNSGTQDYLLASRGAAYSFVGQSSGSAAVLDLFPKDGDGTDSVTLSLWGVGFPSTTTNRERLLVQWDAANSRYAIAVDSNGTGTLRPLRIYTGSNTGQLILNTDGSINTGGTITMADATNIVVGTTTGTQIGTGTTQKLGFYGATPVAQATPLTQTYSTADGTLSNPTAAAITNNTGGAVSTTFAAITAGAGYTQADMTACKNALASTADQLNKARNDHLDLAQMVNKLIDNLQATGIIG